ncbi:MAG: flavin reductase [Bacteroidales bacterium]|nr:flavin reductase [Bacteroidales bacterium]
MKRTMTICATLVALSFLASCGRSHKTGAEVEQGDSTAVETAEAAPAAEATEATGEGTWTKVDPMELEMMPIKSFAEDWKALCVGTSKSMNAMTISWGTIGQLWNKNVVIVYVSSDRYTKRMMDENKYFTVMGFPDNKECREALVYLGSHSKKEVSNKIEEAKLTAEFTELGNPIISEGNLAIECKKIYDAPFDLDKVPSDVREKFYSAIGVHTMYVGEIVNIWKK